MALNVGTKEATPGVDINPYVKEYERLSGQVGRKPAEIRQEVLKIASDRKLNEVVALALWASQNKNQLGGRTDTFTGRLLAAEAPHDVQQDGGVVQAMTLAWVVKNGADYELRAMSIWASGKDGSDRITAAQGLQVDGVYSFRGNVRPNDDTTIRLSEPNFAPSKDPFPSADEIAQADPMPLATAVKETRNLVFTRGIAAKVFKTNRGGGFELWDVGLDVPATVFLSIPVDGAPEGSTIKVLGRISVKQGVATINGMRYWPG